jgi:hypothetical protein
MINERCRTTHHQACDCREAHFEALKAENVRLREALEAMIWAGREAYDNGYPDMERAVMLATKALGK